MSIFDELQQRLASAQSFLGFNPCEVEQQSDDWFKMRLGLITASKANVILGKGQTRLTYMNELIGEICTGMGAEQISNKACDWGNANEPAARMAYEFLTDQPVMSLGFAYGANNRAGCSPDGIVPSTNKGLEIKCPFTTKMHIDYLINGAVKKEYIAQMQFSMWVTGLDLWDFCSFDPRMKRNQIRPMTFERNDTWMKQFDDAVPQFCLEMDRALESLGFNFGEQWLINEAEQVEEKSVIIADSAFN